MNHLLLDVNIVVDVCTERPGSTISVAALASARACGLTVWLYTGSVQTVQYVLAR